MTFSSCTPMDHLVQHWCAHTPHSGDHCFKVHLMFPKYIQQHPNHIQNYANLLTDTQFITMSVYRGTPSKSYLSNTAVIQISSILS